MTIAVVQASQSNGSGTSQTVTLGAGATAGNRLILVIAGRTSGLLTVQPTGFTEQASVNSTTQASIWEKKAAGGETAVTIGFGSTGNNYSMRLYEVSGLDSATLIFDKSATGDSATGVTSLTSGTTAATTIANEFVVAVFMAQNSATAAPFTSVTNSFAIDGNQNQCAYASKIVAATGTQETTFSWTTSRPGSTCIASFKGAAVTPKAGAFPTTRIRPNLMRS